MARPRLACIVLLALATAPAVGCLPNAPATPSAPLSAAIADPAPPTRDELEAVRLRTEIGFQADLAFVRAVALDPRASTEQLGIPLLPEEIEELEARAFNTEAVRGIVQAEADAAPNDFCGMYLDNQNSGALTSMWRANRIQHELSIRTKVHPNARIAFGDCLFSEAQLSHLCDLFAEADHHWMADIPASWTGAECGSADNFVTMYISSAALDAEDRVLRHYTDLFALPPGILVVVSDGNGAALRPWGKVRITVVRPNGKPVGENDLAINWESLDLPNLYCGVGDVGYGVSWNGDPTEIPCQQGVWTMSVEAPVPDADWETIGESQVSVEGGATSKLTIRLTQEPPPPIR